MLQEDRSVVFVVIVELVAIGVFVLVVAGRHHGSSAPSVSPTPVVTAEATGARTRSPAETRPTRSIAPQRATPRAKPSTAPRPKPATVEAARPSKTHAVPRAKSTKRTVAPPKRIRIVAARGDSWLSIHRASQEGRLLFEGTLVKGRVLTHREKRIWVRFGGASNVDVFVNGARLRGLFGTVDAVVDGSGIHPP
jgi:uncharacterized protein DUF4115